MSASRGVLLANLILIASGVYHLGLFWRSRLLDDGDREQMDDYYGIMKKREKGDRELVILDAHVPATSR